MFDGWPCSYWPSYLSYWPSYLHCQRTPCDGYNPPQLLALSHSRVRRNNCLLCVDREYLSGSVRLLFFHTIAHKSPLVLTGKSPRFSLRVLGQRSLGMFFLCGLTVPQHKFFSGPSRHTGQGRKRSCPYIVYAQILLSPLSDLLLYYVLLSGVVPPFVCLYQGKIFISYVYPAESHSLNILMPKSLRFFGMYCLNNTLPLNFTMTSSISKCSEGLKNFEKFVLMISNKSRNFHSLSSFLSTPFLLLSVKCRKTQTFPLLSPHVGEMVRRQNFIRTDHNIDLSPLRAK
jgi:hypothetical protein